MVPRPLPLLPPPSPQRHEVGARARVAELLQLLHAPLADTLLVAERLNVLQVPRDCAAGAAGQPPLEATTGEATTGAGAPTGGGAPTGTAMPMDDLAGAVARGAAGAAATGAARTGTAGAAPASGSAGAATGAGAEPAARQASANFAAAL